MKRIILLVLGSIFTGLGFIGIVVPILPTTPFLLLAAACFARSSDSFYRWLVNHKWLGPYLRNYREKKGMRLRDKVVALGTLWVTIILSALLATQLLWVRILMVVIASGVTFHLVRLNTIRD
ncbi:MAG: DUF454 domain-containing protein [bacterium]|nr:DUF454 domain-containing protein [bacterium]